MCFFPFFSRPRKRRYMDLYSDEDLPPRKKRISSHANIHSQYDTLRGQGVKRSQPRRDNPPPMSTSPLINTGATTPLRGHGVKRSSPKNIISTAPTSPNVTTPLRGQSVKRDPSIQHTKATQTRRPSSRRPARRTEHSQRSIHQGYIEAPVPEINYHSSWICNPPRGNYNALANAAQLENTHALHPRTYHGYAGPSCGLRRQKAYQELRYFDNPWQGY
jgi:hypothetical protein